MVCIGYDPAAATKTNGGHGYLAPLSFTSTCLLAFSLCCSGAEDQGNQGLPQQYSQALFHAIRRSGLKKETIERSTLSECEGHR